MFFFNCFQGFRQYTLAGFTEAITNLSIELNQLKFDFNDCASLSSDRSPSELKLNRFKRSSAFTAFVKSDSNKDLSKSSYNLSSSKTSPPATIKEIKSRQEWKKANEGVKRQIKFADSDSVEEVPENQLKKSQLNSRATFTYGDKNKVEV